MYAMLCIMICMLFRHLSINQSINFHPFPNFPLHVNWFNKLHHDYHWCMRAFHILLVESILQYVQWRDLVSAHLQCLNCTEVLLWSCMHKLVSMQWPLHYFSAVERISGYRYILCVHVQTAVQKLVQWWLSISRSLLLKWTFMLVSVNDKSLYTSQVLIMQLYTRASPTEGWLLRCMLAVYILVD